MIKETLQTDKCNIHTSESCPLKGCYLFSFRQLRNCKHSQFVFVLWPFVYLWDSLFGVVSAHSMQSISYKVFKGISNVYYFKYKIYLLLM